MPLSEFLYTNPTQPIRHRAFCNANVQGIMGNHSSKLHTSNGPRVGMHDCKLSLQEIHKGGGSGEVCMCMCDLSLCVCVCACVLKQKREEKEMNFLAYVYH